MAEVDGNHTSLKAMSGKKSKIKNLSLAYLVKKGNCHKIYILKKLLTTKFGPTDIS